MPLPNPQPAPTPSDEATLLRLLADAARDIAIFATDPDGIILTWNPGVLTITGYEEHEFVGRDCVMLFTPEDRERGAHLQERETARREGQALDERWHLKKDGTRFWGSGVMHALYDGGGDGGDGGDGGGFIGYAKIVRDLTAQKRHEEEIEARVVERAAAFREVQRRLLSVQEEERRRISRELHDQTGQHLAALGITLGTIERAARAAREASARAALDASAAARAAAETAHAAQVAADAAARVDAAGDAAGLAREASEAARAAAIAATDAGARAGAAAAAAQVVDQTAPTVGHLRGLVDSLSRDIHRIAVDLRPTSLDDLGLVPALESYAAEWSTRTGVPAQFEAVGLEGERLPPLIETTVYRVVQEALSNAAKYAAGDHVPGGATRASVTVQKRDGLLLATIEDNGPGFDAEAAASRRRLGLVGMRERAELAGGSVEIETAPGEGTTIYLRLPLA